MTDQAKKDQTKKENSFLNLFCNILAPIAILKYAGNYFEDNGPLIALVIAFCLPLGYGIYDYIQRRKKNWISALGMLSVLTTGGLAVIKAEGVWFAITEAALPLLMGIGVFVSAFTRKAFVSAFFLNEAIAAKELIHQKVLARNQTTEFARLIKRSTIYFSLSLFFSALMNFVLAIYIFRPIDIELDEATRSQILNDQLAQMKGYSMVVIAIPGIIISGLVLWYLVKGLKRVTGLNFEELFPAAK